MLRDGVSIGGASTEPEIDIPCYPSSPSWQQVTAVVLDILASRLDAASASERVELLRKPISRSDVVLSLTGLLMHYDARRIAEVVADTIVENLTSFGVVRRVDADHHVLTSSGRTLATVVRDVERQYMEGLAQRKGIAHAVERIREQYRETTPMLFEFEE